MSILESKAEPIELFRKSFDLVPFIFSHRLSGHPLFSLPALKVLTEKWVAKDNDLGFFRISNSAQGLKWGTCEFQKAVRDALDNLETSKLRLKLSAVHLEPAYEEVLKECTQELSALIGINLSRLYKDARATIFISSPGEITPYHIDQEANFLFELRGSKTVWIADGNDRKALSWQDLEAYWHDGAVVPPPPTSMPQVRRFELRPGFAIHNPVNFPHWVANGSTSSVALSLGYTRVDDPIDVLRINYYLRKLGMTPIPPGESRLRDNTKRNVVECGRQLRRLIRGIRNSQKPPNKRFNFSHGRKSTMSEEVKLADF